MPQIHNGRGIKKKSYSLAEKQAYVRIYQQAKSNAVRNRGLMSQVAREQGIDKRNLCKWVKSVSLDPIRRGLKETQKD